MLKKTITYTDFDGNEKSKDYYFNLSKGELLEMEMSSAGGFANMINAIINEGDAPQLFEKFKNIVLRSYGVKSPDGERFIKSKEISEAFEQSNAYSELMMEICTDADAAAAFINGIMPAEQRPQVDPSTRQ